MLSAYSAVHLWAGCVTVDSALGELICGLLYILLPNALLREEYRG